MCEVIKSLFNQPYEIQNKVLSRWSGIKGINTYPIDIEINGKVYSDLPMEIVSLINNLIEEVDNKKE